MGRLAVILGSNALGPGGEEIAAAAAEHGAAIVQRHGGGDPYVLPHRIDHAANLRPLRRARPRPRPRARVGRWAAAPSWAVGTLPLPGRLHRPPLGLSIFDDGRAHTAPASTPTGATGPLHLGGGRPVHA